MRWERLFADLEAQASAMELDDRDQLVADLIDESWSELSWSELLGGRVELEVMHHGVIAGDVVVATDLLVHLESPGCEWVISAPAVLAVLEAERRAAPLTSVTRALSWGRVWRLMRESGQEVTITRTDGSSVSGWVDSAGSDFVMMRRGSLRTVVPNSGVATLSRRQ